MAPNFITSARHDVNSTATSAAAAAAEYPEQDKAFQDSARPLSPEVSVAVDIFTWFGINCRPSWNTGIAEDQALIDVNMFCHERAAKEILGGINSACLGCEKAMA